MPSPELEKSHQTAKLPSRLLATALSAVALAGASNMESDIETARAETSPANGCEFSLLKGSLTPCQPEEIPPACVLAAQDEIEHFDYSAYRRKRGHLIARRSGLFNAGYKEEPHLRISIQDDGAIVENQHGRAESVLFLGRTLGATGLRMIYYPHDFKDQEKTNNYLLAIDRAQACGYDNIHMTIACNKKRWSVKKFDNYFSATIRRFEDRIDSVTPCNEPNFPGWLKRMPGKTLPETYRTLYDTGFTAARREAPSLKVVFGDFAGTEYPLPFAKEAMDYCSKAKSRHSEANQQTGSCPVVADLISFHPYEFPAKPNSPVQLDQEVKPDAKKIGTSSVSTYVSAVDRFYEEGKIRTPDGQKPKVDFNEWGAMVRSRREMSVRNEKDPHRAKKYVKFIEYLCSDPTVAKAVVGLNIYQFDDPPLHWGGTWSTSLAALSGKLDLTYYSTRSGIRNNKECIKR